MRIIETKAEIKIDEEGNHSISIINLAEKTEIEQSERDDSGSILSFTQKIKEFNDKEINLTKKILGKNSSGQITFRLLVS